MTDEEAAGPRQVSMEEFQRLMDEITDVENDCAACGVNPRAEASRYCESCHATLVEGA